jgi:DNA-binding transcriptional ArsR family regulator
MLSTVRIAEIASMAGDVSRAAMLHALMDGRALTASELSRVAGIMPQTASTHLQRLVEAGLLSVVKQGRHRYHRLASPAVATMLESIMQLAAFTDSGRAAPRTGPRDEVMRNARTCYDHLAGRLGVAIADALIAAGHVDLGEDAGLMSVSGARLFRQLGMDLTAMESRRGKRPARIFCRPCLDWSERRPHMAGVVAAALCNHSLEQGWIRRVKQSRAIIVTPAGTQILRDALGIPSTAYTGAAGQA